MRFFRQSTSSSDDKDDAITIDLVAVEKMNVQYEMAPTTTVDWFQGNCGDATTALRNKMDAILTANPWLAGRYLGNDRFEYSESQRYFDVRDMLVAVEDAKKSPILNHETTSYNELIAIGHNEELGLTLTAKNYEAQPFWKVAVVPTPDPQYFALYVSLSHGVGDGYTFYSLYNMLVGGTDVRAMTPSRLSTSHEQQEEAFGKAEANYGVTIGMIIFYLWGTFQDWFSKLRSSKPSTQRTHRLMLVDKPKIQTIKDQYKANTASSPTSDFISTNDIITSTLFSLSECSYGGMAMNLRGRLDGHTKDHAFNAENDLLFRIPEDVASPELIRKATTSMKRAVTADRAWSAWEFGKPTDTLCFVTNWASFKTDKVELEGCKDLQHVVHLPAYDMSTAITPNVSMGVIFKHRKGELAVLLGGTPKRLEPFARGKVDFESGAIFEMLPSQGES